MKNLLQESGITNWEVGLNFEYHRKMKAVFIKRNLTFGGSSKMLAFVANAMAQEGHDVTMVLYEGSDVMQPLHSNIKVWNKNIMCQGATKHFKMISQLKKIIKEIAPDVIISFLCFPNFYATIIGRILRIPVIISERGNPYTLKGLRNRIIYSMFNLANGAVFQTEGARAFFGKGLQKRAAVIANPVVKREGLTMYDPKTGNHVISHIARYENVQKRQDLMIKSMHGVIKSYPDAILKLYGEGADLEMLQNIVKEEKLTENVLFMGRTDKPEQAMIDSEVFALTSDYEGIPNTVIEAMSVGMPVVSTDCDPGGARLLIENGTNGFIVPKNNPEAIAEKIVELFSNQDLREKFSKEAAKITERFTEEKIAGQWLEYIHKIAKK